MSRAILDGLFERARAAQTADRCLNRKHKGHVSGAFAVDLIQALSHPQLTGGLERLSQDMRQGRARVPSQLRPAKAIRRCGDISDAVHRVLAGADRPLRYIEVRAAVEQGVPDRWVRLP